MVDIALATKNASVCVVWWYSASYGPESHTMVRFAEIPRTCRPVNSHAASGETSFGEDLIARISQDLLEPSMIVTTLEFIYFSVRPYLWPDRAPPDLCTPAIARGNGTNAGY